MLAMPQPITQPQALIEAHNLTVLRNDRLLLDKVNLRIDAGKIVTLIGPNGAGKTTLVRSILGLSEIDSGSIERQPNLRVGYMPQKLHLDASLPLSVDRFLTLSVAQSTPLEEIKALTGIQTLGKSPMSSLSGGETQRVLLARALLRDPQLLVLDEPVQGVDVGGQTALYALINQIRQTRNCGVLLVSHDLHLVMATTDTVICLNQHVCCHGHPTEVTQDPAFRALFGDKISADNGGVRFYAHHHDHQHNTHGDVIRGVHDHSGHQHTDKCGHHHE